MGGHKQSLGGAWPPDLPVATALVLNIYYYLWTNRGSSVVCIAQTVCVLHHSKYIAICSIDVVADGFGSFDLFLHCEIDDFAKS